MKHTVRRVKMLGEKHLVNFIVGPSFPMSYPVPKSTVLHFVFSCYIAPWLLLYVKCSTAIGFDSPIQITTF